MLYSEIKETNYECFSTKCPHCGYWNIFNRRDDFGTFEPIDFREVECFDPSCQRRFNINGDIVNPAYELLLMEGNSFIKIKSYMLAVLNVAQALESFFSLLLTVELLYRPFARNKSNGLNEINNLSKMLYEKIKSCTFTGMTYHLFDLLIKAPKLNNISESEAYITSMPDKPNKPKKTLIDSIINSEMKNIAEGIYNTEINELRNRVVHKMAYRPSKEEAESAINEASKYIHKLQNHFKIVGDNINWYINECI